MPTINQLVREGRTQSVKKSNSPALLKSMNSIKRVPTDTKANNSLMPKTTQTRTFNSSP